MTKKELRKFAKKLRADLDLKPISEAICKNISDLEEFKNAKNIMLYSPFGSEIDVFCLLSNQDKTWILPKVEGEDIIPYFYTIGDDLIENKWQIKEPFLESRCATHKDVDLIVVPGLCVDKCGYRLGYGFGFYDRLLRALPAKAIKIIPVVEELFIDEVPKDLWDEPLDIVVTEKDIYRIKA